MKLRTSYFNTGVFRKNLTRFAPVWVLYTVFIMLIMLTYYTYGDDWSYLDDMLRTSFTTMSIINLFYGWLVAVTVFPDLFKSRLCNALHAMPLRREGWFLTNVVSGLAFSFVPNLLVSLLMMTLLKSAWAAALVWLLVMFGQYLLFFGVAVFSVYCAGTMLGMSCVYAIVNFLPMIVYAVVELVYEPQLYGVVIQMEPFTRLCPVAGLSAYYINTVSINGNHVFRVISEDMAYLAVYSLVGVGFLTLGMLIYRKRNLESAGNFLAVKWMKPVFLFAYTACVVLLIQAVFYIPAILALPLGFFTGMMLLERRVKVFNKKTFAGFGIVLGVLLLSFVLTVLDPLGVTRWVPEEEDVEEVTVYRMKLTATGLEDYYWESGKAFTLSDPEDIEGILAIHQGCVDDRYRMENTALGFAGQATPTSIEFADGEEKWYTSLTLVYEMNSGATVQRSYNIDVDSAHGQQLKAYYARPQAVLGTEGEDLDSFIRSMKNIDISGSDYAPWGDELRSLVEAMLKDCQTGALVQEQAYHHEEDDVIYLRYDLDDGQYRYVHIYPCCENTVAWLEENGYLDN